MSAVKTFCSVEIDEQLATDQRSLLGVEVVRCEVWSVVAPTGVHRTVARGQT